MNIELISLFMFGSLIVLLLLNVPIAFATGVIGVAATLLLWSPGALSLLPAPIYSLITNHVLVATPMFIFMGVVLERAGVAEDLYEAVYRWMGSLRGGLAIATVVACIILSAMVGVLGASVMAMGLIALPAMLKRRYNKYIAMGTIMAGGSLGILIPPSVMLVLYATYAGESIGAMFAGAVFPGLLLGALFIIYVGIRCWLNPNLGPALPKEERSKITLLNKLAYLKGLILPLILVAAVLGSIFTGIATPTEASGVGALGALICAAVRRRLDWQLIKHTCYTTLRTSTMIFWIGFGALYFVSVYNALGGIEFMRLLILALPVDPWVMLAGMMLILIVLGMIMEWVGLIFLTVPIFVPVAEALGFNTLWFGVLFAVNMQMDVLVPPFGYALFYMKGVAPEGITTGDIYRASIPFAFLQALGLLLCIIFPEIVLSLPTRLFG
jgi:tripartite ATP-independent transporter DctM subunit